MKDPRDQFLHDTSSAIMRVDFSSSPIVLLCGGRVPEKSRPDDPDPPLQSLRHAISLNLPDFELFRPEEITDWQADGIYKNLMDFESDLAGICSLIVIILESAGSIAELGAFSQLEDLSRRLMVCTSSQFETEKSFIDLGILRHLKAKKAGSVRTYPWTIPDSPRTQFSVEGEIINDILEDIRIQLGGLPQSPKFIEKNTSHIMALIHHLLSLFVALKITELEEYLNHFGVVITEDNLKRKLFLLQRFDLVLKDDYSDSTFYMARERTYHRVRFDLTSGEQFDSLRLRTSCANFYLRSNDRHRLGFLKKVRSGNRQ